MPETDLTPSRRILIGIRIALGILVLIATLFWMMLFPNFDQRPSDLSYRDWLQVMTMFALVGGGIGGGLLGYAERSFLSTGSVQYTKWPLATVLGFVSGLAIAAALWYPLLVHWQFAWPLGRQLLTMILMLVPGAVVGFLQSTATDKTQRRLAWTILSSVTWLAITVGSLDVFGFTTDMILPDSIVYETNRRLVDSVTIISSIGILALATSVRLGTLVLWRNWQRSRYRSIITQTSRE
ncbi:MAG: hypothetical protein KDE20_01400 [Caldilineaceae bacterium]|nr:hypothetical protein [Caldilineaceae bacterium]